MTSEQNKAIARRFFQASDAGLLAPDLVAYTHGAPGLIKGFVSNHRFLISQRLKVAFTVEMLWAASFTITTVKQPDNTLRQGFSTLQVA